MVLKTAKVLLWSLFIALHVSAAGNSWGPYRGVNTHPMITEKDLADLADMGANLIRLSFDTMPLVDREPPYQFNEEAFQRLDRIIDLCEQYGLSVVIDPHTVPGAEKHTTMSPQDLFWTDKAYHQHLIGLWRRIARKYSDHGPVIAGYDLLNEPASPRGFPESGPGSWNELVDTLVKEIRRFDREHWIIIEPAIGTNLEGKHLDRFASVSKLKLPDDSKLVISPHMYLPHPFTHQGVNNKPVGVPYPGEVANRGLMLEKMEPVLLFQKESDIPVYIGEFSASRFAGPDGDQYIKDLIEVMESYGWSWTYHDFRGADVWNPELSVNDPLSTIPSDTPRIRILKKAWSANRSE